MRVGLALWGFRYVTSQYESDSYIDNRQYCSVVNNVIIY